MFKFISLLFLTSITILLGISCSHNTESKNEKDNSLIVKNQNEPTKSIDYNYNRDIMKVSSIDTTFTFKRKETPYRGKLLQKKQ